MIRVTESAPRTTELQIPTYLDVQAIGDAERILWIEQLREARTDWQIVLQDIVAEMCTLDGRVSQAADALRTINRSIRALERAA